MEAYERQALLDRIERDSATVGVAIPERLDLRGETVALRERILALQQTTPLSSTEEREREELLVALRRKRTALVERLETEEMDRSAGEDLVDRIVGIDRARAALRAAGEETDIEEEIRKRHVADMERWQSFIKQTRRGIDRSLDR